MTFKETYCSGIGALLDNPAILHAISQLQCDSQAAHIAASAADYALTDLARCLSVFAHLAKERGEESLVSQAQALQALATFAELAGDCILQAANINVLASVCEALNQAKEGGYE